MAAEENQTKQHHQVEKPRSPRKTSTVNTWNDNIAHLYSQEDYCGSNITCLIEIQARLKC